jgi:hypothetical protein
VHRKGEKPSEESLLTAYTQTVQFIVFSENGRFHLLQIYILALTALITASAIIFANGYGKIDTSILFIPLVVILAFLALLSAILYLIFLRWDVAYAYNMAQLSWISEKLGLARKMPGYIEKNLRDRYEELNRKYGGFPWMILLPKRDGVPEWALIDEAYGPPLPPSSIRVHPWFDRFLLICMGSSLTFSIFLAFYVVFKRSTGMFVPSGILLFFVVLYVLFKYDEKLQNKLVDEVNLFKVFRKPIDVKISALERKPEPSRKKYEEYKRFISVLDFVIVFSFFSVAITCLLGWIEFSYIEVLLILALGLISMLGSRLLLSRYEKGARQT